MCARTHALPIALGVISFVAAPLFWVLSLPDAPGLHTLAAIVGQFGVFCFWWPLIARTRPGSRGRLDVVVRSLSMILVFAMLVVLVLNSPRLQVTAWLGVTLVGVLYLFRRPRLLLWWWVGLLTAPVVLVGIFAAVHPGAVRRAVGPALMLLPWAGPMTGVLLASLRLHRRPPRTDDTSSEPA